MPISSRLTQARGLKRDRGGLVSLADPSRLTQARGLKQQLGRIPAVSLGVAPYAGAWIETSRLSGTDWSALPSRLTQARGLKPLTPCDVGAKVSSRLTQARGLKLV